MKRIILRYGLISGFIVAAWCVVSIAICYSRDDFEGNMLLGYASMILAFSFIYVGIRKQREENGGNISFGKALLTGVYISLVASTIYVVVWLIDYYIFIPDFMDHFVAYMLRQTQENGATAQELAQKATELAAYKEMYKNPLLVILFTYAEVLPVGLIISVISALLLKRKAASVYQVA